MSLKKVSKATLRRDATTVVHKATLVTMVQDLQKQVLHVQKQLKEVRHALAAMLTAPMISENKCVASARCKAMKGKKGDSCDTSDASCQSSPTSLGRIKRLTAIPSVMADDGKTRARALPSSQ